MLSVVEKAEVFAYAAHKAVLQVRKYTGEDYIVHPREVAALLTQAGCSDEAIAAGWLHDVVEDTRVELSDITLHFGERIASYVAFVTEIKSNGITRAARKEMTRKRLKDAPNEVKSLKLADVISNSRSIVDRDPKFAQVYMVEQKNLVATLKDGGSPYLVAKAEEILENYFQKDIDI